MFRPRRLGSWVFALTAASALVIASSMARAEDWDGDFVPDHLEEAAERNVAVATSPRVAPTAVSITSQSVGAAVNDRFRIRYSEGEFEVDYFPDTSSVPRVSYSLELRSLVEWVDGGDGVFEESEITWSLPLGSDAFRTVPVAHTNATSTDGGNLDRFAIRSDGGEITLVLTIAQRFLRLSPERILTPMEAKLDLYMNRTLHCAASRVAIELELETRHEMRFGTRSWDVTHNFSKDESWVNVTSGTYPEAATAFFSWSDYAEVDGIRGRVAATPPVGSGDTYTMYLIYPAGPRSDRVAVSHDPALGVVSAAYEGILRLPEVRPFQGDPPVYAISLVGMAVLVGGTMVLARRRRYKA